MLLYGSSGLPWSVPQGAENLQRFHPLRMIHITSLSKYIHRPLQKAHCRFAIARFDVEFSMPTKRYGIPRVHLSQKAGLDSEDLPVDDIRPTGMSHLGIESSQGFED